MVTIRYLNPADEHVSDQTDQERPLTGRVDWLPNSRQLNKRQFHAQVRKLAAAGYTDRAIARHIGVGLNLVRSILTGDTPEPPEAA